MPQHTPPPHVDRSADPTRFAEPRFAEPRFAGVWIPIITPFDGPDGARVDHAALAGLARALAGTGIAGFVAGATTGEGALLHPGEDEAVFATLREAAPALPVLLGLSASATADATAQARRLAALRPDGLLVTPPGYLRPSQDGIRRHFEAVVAAADRPVLVYSIPYRTGVAIEVETLSLLARDPRVAGIKECGGDDERLTRLLDETPLTVLSGDDQRNFVALCLGAHGTIAASAHLHPAAHVRMRDCIAHGRLDEARRIARRLQPLTRSLFAEPSPAPLKALLAALGRVDDAVRLPFVPVGPALRERLLDDYRNACPGDAAA